MQKRTISVIVSVLFQNFNFVTFFSYDFTSKYCYGISFIRYGIYFSYYGFTLFIMMLLYFSFFVSCFYDFILFIQH